ncbi:MAG TPA: hypothetical protein VEQ59_24985, partial [Polyangiaceae bacterium]|nr:hypothetical protein [Polyangiaceae bacterium]
PTFHDLTLYGGHDWDEMTAHRLLTVRALLGFGQLPLWMPYACGGYSEWGNVVGASNLIAPSLPFYLLLELRHALRLELVLSLLISAAGCWCLAAQLTRSAAARSFACLIFVANGRWALQAATGHLWHLEYCYLPWVFWAFERLLASRRLGLGPLVTGASALALMLYAGGIYPLPHAVLLLGVYAMSRAALERSTRPLVAYAALGALAVGLAAPKLLPVAIEFGERPRLIASTEAIDFSILWQALVAPGQTPGSRPIAIPQWGWHEYGMYIGWAPALLVLLGTLWPAPRRELALKLSGLVALLLGFGAFHRFAPWTLLHELGPFRSQHVPMRWLYPALLLLGVATAAAFGRQIEQLRARRFVEPVLLAGCLLLAVDIGQQAAIPMQQAFWMRARPTARAKTFAQFERVPRHLQYQRRDYAPEAVPALLAGSGVLQCNVHASLSIYAPKAENGRPFGMGARGQGESDYRGEAFTQSGVGTAQLVAFSPNRVVVELRDAKVGDRLVLNQNFDAGWRVDGGGVERYRDAIATPITAPNAQVTFRFWPRGFTAGLWCFALTLAVVALLVWRRAAAPSAAP